MPCKNKTSKNKNGKKKVSKGGQYVGTYVNKILIRESVQFACIIKKNNNR